MLDTCSSESGRKILSSLSLDKWVVSVCISDVMVRSEVELRICCIIDGILCVSVRIVAFLTVSVLLLFISLWLKIRSAKLYDRSSDVL